MARISAGPTSGKMTETALRLQEQQKADERLGRQIRANAYKQNQKILQQQMEQQHEMQVQQQQFQFQAQQAAIDLASRLTMQRETQKRLEAQSETVQRFKEDQAKAERKYRAAQYQLEERKTKGKEYAEGMEFDPVAREFKLREDWEPLSETVAGREAAEAAEKGEQAVAAMGQRFGMLATQYSELMQQEPGAYEFFSLLASNSDLPTNSMLLRATEYANEIGKDRAIAVYVDPMAPLEERRRAALELGKGGPVEDQVREWYLRGYLKRHFEQDPEVMGWKAEISRLSIELGRLAYADRDAPEVARMKADRKALGDMVRMRRKETLEEADTLKIGDMVQLTYKSLLPTPEALPSPETKGPLPSGPPGFTPPGGPIQDGIAPTTPGGPIEWEPTTQAVPTEGDHVGVTVSKGIQLRQQDPKRYQAFVEGVRKIAEAGTETWNLDATRILALLGEE